MQFGWLTLSMSPSGDEDADRIEQQIELVCEAEALGFHDVWLTEHYYGSPQRVREQVAELRDAGVGHLLCQTGFGDMSQEQNLDL